MFPFPYPPEQTQYVVNEKIISVSMLWKFYALYYTESFITYRSEGRNNNNQLSALPPVSQTSSSMVWLERWLEAICGRCWVDNFLKHAWLSSKDYMTMWKGLGGGGGGWHHANGMKEAGQRGASMNAFCITSLTSCSGITRILWTYLIGVSY